MERRTPLTPRHIKRLIEQQGLNVVIEQSPKRIFSDDEYRQSGAQVEKFMESSPVVFGVKEIPKDYFREGNTYVFFSHVIKGQAYNMPMLQTIMDKGCTLIDYEKIEDESGKRLIFFGRFAGLAGMINSLWSLGLRLKEYGFETPFLKIKQAHKYGSLAEAKNVISEVGFDITRHGLPDIIQPITIGFTGYGNVSIGAQEICNLLPVKEIAPEELPTLNERYNLPGNVIYKTVFKEEHLAEPRDTNTEFELQEYYHHPERFNGIFEQYIPHLSVLMNCMYWDDRYPRLITRVYLEKAYAEGEPKLKVIGDVTCDPDGSIEATHIGTEIEDPIFVYDPFTREPQMGHKGKGLLIMAVDILPSELPRESSVAFGDALFKFVKPIAETDYRKPFDQLDLPGPVKRAVIVHKGELTPDYKYIEAHL